VTGLDFAPSAVVAARGVAERAGLAERAEFVCGGALCWLPSVDHWAAQVGALVAPGGRFYLHDGHPLAWALADERPQFDGSYFEEPEALVDDSGYTYAGSDATLENKRSYRWDHGDR
jgi:hypothetical protein